MMRRILALVILAAAAAYSQPPNALLPAKDAAELFKRSLQLAESTSAAVPGLSQAGGPVLENARQALINLESGPAGSVTLTYNLLTNLRAYLVLAESVPKPYPFPEEGRRQFAELRDSVDRVESHFRASLEQNERRLRNPDRDNLRRYAEDDARLPKTAADRKRIVFLGDSITDGWRLNEYFPGREFVNRGISGQITGEMLGRMKADVIDLKPAGMLVLAGTNDIARGVPLSTIVNNLVMIADLADAYKIKPMFASVLPISDYHKAVNPRYEMSKQRPPSAILDLNRWIEAFCKQRHYTYVDYFAQMVDPRGQMKAELADDGLHPNSAGYRVMGPVALAAIDRNFGPPPAAAPVVSSKRTSKTRTPQPVADPVQTLAPAPPPPPTSGSQAAEVMKAEEAMRAEQARKAADAQRAAELERAAEARKLDEANRAAEAQRAAENQKAAEIQKAAEAQRAAEIRQAEEAKRLEANRAAEAQRAAENQKAADEKAAEAKRTSDAKEAKRIADAERKAEAKRVADAKKAADAERAAEARKVAEAKKAAAKATADAKPEADEKADSAPVKEKKVPFWKRTYPSTQPKQ